MNQADDVKARTEVRDGMRITWHQGIEMDDGIVLRADVYRPVDDGKYPVILTYGVYAKGLAFQDGYPLQWGKQLRKRMGATSFADVTGGDSASGADDEPVKAA